MTANREPCPVSVATSQLDQQAHCYGGPHHHSHAVHDHGQPACLRHDRLFHSAAPGDLHRLSQDHFGVRTSMVWAAS